MNTTTCACTCTCAAGICSGCAGGMKVAGYCPAKLNYHDQSTIAVKTAAMHVTCRFITRIMMIHQFVVAGLADTTMLQCTQAKRRACLQHELLHVITATRLIYLKRPHRRFRRLFREATGTYVLPGIAWARDHAPRWGWKCPRRWPSFGTGHS